MRHWILASLLALATLPATAADLIGFWNSPRHGGNSFNRLPPDQAYFEALRGYGATWVRLSYDKWRPEKRDFLLGNADAYQGLAAADLAQLRAVLDRAHAAGLKVVIAPLSLPGMRWAQNNEGQFDDRLWQDKGYWTQAANFWRDLAQALGDHPAIAAYNLVNEPAPEKQGGLPEHADPMRMKQWYQQVQGGARDLPALYRQLIAAIREVDATTPIMVDAGWYAAADAFSYWPAPLADERVLYSLHMYEPYSATSAPNMARQAPIAYPGPAPFAGRSEPWGARRVAQYLQQPLDWMATMKLPRSRLVVGEFGCMRRLPGCRQYLEDVLSVLDRQQVHWAFYSFREDSWDGMDYELGSAKVPWRYWQAIEQGAPDPLPRKATAEFEPIRSRLAR
ncbi:glycoside hydrolase family 5 protein [Pseudomonas guariconensis]|uniref:glycoside hydrolase family 5 protein n=1 Tax=Pseudomonas guariconensis TaxID=1288410 RepID=UPI00209B8013|nr:cellulase family glycosylhydrolase [Pseudomonas guariconensis]MCO7632817.1 glycoside hydrolase family 5 protein [Pseudomonas guariconensis]